MTHPDLVVELPVVASGYDRGRTDAVVAQLQGELRLARRRADQLAAQVARLTGQPAGSGGPADRPSAAEPAAGEPDAPLVLGVDHVGVAVEDVDAAARLLGELLGLRVSVREENADQQVDEAVLHPADHRAGDHPGHDPSRGAGVQLVAPQSPDSAVGRFLQRRGPGLHHLAFRVRDVDAAAEALRRRGVRVLYDEARPGTAGSRITFVHPRDTGGVLVELVEQPAAEGSSAAPGED